MLSKKDFFQVFLNHVNGDALYTLVCRAFVILTTLGLSTVIRAAIIAAD